MNAPIDKQSEHGPVNVIRIVDYYAAGCSCYLVMKRTTGQNFQQVIEGVLNNRTWFCVQQYRRQKLLTHYLHILQQVKWLHALGYVHRDLTPANFLITSNGTAWLIDQELLDHIALNPAFGPGPSGNMLQEQLQIAVPGGWGDIYALGCMLSWVVTGFDPAPVITGGEIEKVQKLLQFTHDINLSYLVAACTDADPAKRPPLNVVIQVVEDSLERVDRELPEVPNFSTWGLGA